MKPATDAGFYIYRYKFLSFWRDKNLYRLSILDKNMYRLSRFAWRPPQAARVGHCDKRLGARQNHYRRQGMHVDPRALDSGRERCANDRPAAALRGALLPFGGPKGLWHRHARRQVSQPAYPRVLERNMSNRNVPIFDIEVT
ncbi:hypothetical protein [Paenibacillus cymbidii]|uniref:hypothetical protein n=1 Tax=Paenibacillus cymbidii TaxID=1639034 RepID=UPI0010810CA4|nr:hypothetical protein [Paenibacillus cymbidii]